MVGFIPLPLGGGSIPFRCAKRKLKILVCSIQHQQQPDGISRIQTNSNSAKGTMIMLPQQHMRLKIDEKSGFVSLQTAVIRFRKSDVGKDLTLISIVHLADKAYYNKIKQIAEDSESVFCELLVNESLLTQKTQPDGHGASLRLLRDKAYPTMEAKRFAAQYGCIAQLEALDPFALTWYIADLSFEELTRRETKNMYAKFKAGQKRSSLELFKAIWTSTRASTLSFTDFFLRALIWFLPGPELGLVLFDWIKAGGKPAPILLALVDSIRRLDILTSRRLIFAQVLVSEQQRYADRMDLVLRNERAVDVVMQGLDIFDSASLVYGGTHTPDLADRIRLEHGYKPIQTDSDSVVEWIDAWKIKSSKLQLDYGLARSIAFSVPAYMIVDAIDWITTIDSVIGSFVSIVPPAMALQPVSMSLSAAPSSAMNGSMADALLFVGFYMFRHAALYIFLTKWTVDWSKDLFD